MKAPALRRSPEQWRQIFEALAASGLTRKQFCHQNGLHVETLRRAEQRLGGRVSTTAPFIEFPVTPTAGNEPGQGWDLELELGMGLVLRLIRR